MLHAQSCMGFQMYLDIPHDDPDECWPKKLYYGLDKCVKFSCTCHEKPNTKVRSARCHCKSYRTYCCMARLEIKETGGKDCYTFVGENSRD